MDRNVWRLTTLSATVSVMSTKLQQFFYSVGQNHLPKVAPLIRRRSKKPLYICQDLCLSWRTWKGALKTFKCLCPRCWNSQRDQKRIVGILNDGQWHSIAFYLPSIQNKNKALYMIKFPCQENLALPWQQFEFLWYSGTVFS